MSALKEIAKDPLSTVLPGPWVSMVDLESDEMGTGARMNSGKLPVELIPVRHWVSLFWSMRGNANDHEVESARLIKAVDALATFQEGNYDGRTLISSIMPYWFDEAAHVFAMNGQPGAKYKMWNWLHGMQWSVPLACAIRHARDILIVGEEYDQESGLRHIGHFTCNVLMLAQYSTTYRAGNDLPNPKYFREERKINE